MMKKIALAIAVVVIAIAGGAYFLASNLDGIVKAAIEKYGSEATQASVTLKGVDIAATEGRAGLRGLVVGNPKGFNTPEAMSLGDISVTLDIASLQSNPIVIKQVLIQQPAITYEFASGGSNLDVLQKNLQAYAAQFGGGGKSGGGSSPAASPEDKAGERKIVIEDLVISGGRIGISAAALQGRSLSSTLPTIQLKNIGRDKGGASPAEVAQRVLGTISAEASKIAASDLQKQLGTLLKDGLKDGAGSVGGAAGGAAEKLKGLFGK
ncbi:hypothetical protein [Ferrovibrio sp.]|uniref:hypothetical protein n=1 Tax=Ferrovibrio sp. TaxID=1917215 RepID=UPI00311D87D8